MIGKVRKKPLVTPSVYSSQGFETHRAADISISFFSYSESNLNHKICEYVHKIKQQNYIWQKPKPRSIVALQKQGMSFVL